MGRRVSRQSYKKPWLSWSEQLAKLQGRGIVVTDTSAAIAFLSHINYYRFSGYCLAFESSRHSIIPGTTFDQIREAYEFDCALRDLVGEALEHIEIDLRTSIGSSFGRAHGPFGHVEATNFHRLAHTGWIRRVREESDRSNEKFVAHFRKTYREYPDLPIWVVTEIMSFGTLSIMFKHMLRADQKAVARRYNLQARTLAQWMHHLVYIRNMCAHHARLWDRIWAIKPMVPHGRKWHPPVSPANDRLFFTLLILHQIQSRCDGITRSTRSWRQRIESLLRSPPSVDQAEDLLGLPQSWSRHPLFRAI